MTFKLHIFLTGVVVFVCFKGVQAQCVNRTALLLPANETEQTFQSPNYPNPYPSNSYCQWLIEAPNDNYTVELKTLHLSLEYFFRCFDNITVYNGKHTSTIKRVFCFGNYTVETTERHLLVLFQSDNDGQGTGFKFSYRAKEKKHRTTYSPVVIPTTPRPRSTTADPQKGSSRGVNKWVLVGGVVGGIAFIVIVSVLCYGNCCKRSRSAHHHAPTHRAASFYHSHAPGTPLHDAAENGTTSTAVHMVQSSNTVVMVSHSMGGGGGRGALPPLHTLTNLSAANGLSNLGFEADWDGMGLGVPMGVPPPSYDESMLHTNPAAAPPTPRRLSPGANLPAAFPPGTGGLAPPPLFAPRVRAVVPGQASAGDGATGEPSSPQRGVVPPPCAQTSAHPSAVSSASSVAVIRAALAQPAVGGTPALSTVDETPEQSAVEQAPAVQSLDGETPAQPADRETQAQGEDVETQAQPTDVETQAQSADVETQAQPTDVETQAQPTDVETQAQPTDVETQAQPTDVETQAQPTDVETQAQSADVETQAQPADVETPFQPADVETLVQGEDVETPAVATIVEMAAQPTTVGSPAQSSAEPLSTEDSSGDDCQRADVPPHSSPSPVDCALSTSPCSSQSSQGSPAQEPQAENEGGQSASAMTRVDTESTEPGSQCDTSSEWPHGTGQTTESQTSSCPEEIVADTSDGVLTKPSPLQDSTLYCDKAQSEGDMATVPVSGSPTEASLSETRMAEEQAIDTEVVSASQGEAHEQSCQAQDAGHDCVSEDWKATQCTDGSVASAQPNNVYDETSAGADADTNCPSSANTSAEDTVPETSGIPDDKVDTRMVSQPPDSHDNSHDNLERSASGSIMPPPASLYTCESVDSSDSFPLPPPVLVADPSIENCEEHTAPASNDSCEAVDCVPGSSGGPDVEDDAPGSTQSPSQ